MTLLAAAGIALVGATVTVWAVLVEPRRFVLRRIVLDAETAGLPPMRLLHLSDTHFDGCDRPLLRFLERVARRTEPLDFVFFTGDIIDKPGGVTNAVKAAKLFRPRLGAFAVLGGHDYAHAGPLEAYLRFLPGRARGPASRPNPVRELVQALQRCGVRCLEDACVRLNGPDGRPVAVVGLRDAFVFEPDYDEAWRPVAPDVPVVCIAHSPDALPEVCRRGARLALFGHTHGGQVRLPCVGALVTRCRRLPRRMARGLFKVGPTVGIISAGLGVSRATGMRLFCRPEAILIDIRPNAGAAADRPVQVDPAVLRVTLPE